MYVLVLTSRMRKLELKSDWSLIEDKRLFFSLTLYSLITPFDAFEISCI